MGSQNTAGPLTNALFHAADVAWDMPLSAVVGLPIVGHAAVVSASAARGLLAPPPPPLPALEGTRAPGPVVDWIADAYRGEPFDTGVLWEDCVFEDPVATVAGREEVMEAMCAMRELRPETLASPQLIAAVNDIDRPNHIFRYVFSIRQRYLDRFQLESHLSILVEDNMIRHVQERWNGKPLLPFAARSRRINGVLGLGLCRVIAHLRS